MWQPIKIYPATQYRKLWQYYLLKLLRLRLKGNWKACWWIGRLHRKYPTGFIVNVMLSLVTDFALQAVGILPAIGRGPMNDFQSALAAAAANAPAVGRTTLPSLFTMAV